MFVRCPKCGRWWSVKLVEKKLTRAKLSKNTSQNLKNGSKILSKLSTTVEKCNDCSPFITIPTRLAGILLGGVFDYWGRNFVTKKYYCRKCDYKFSIEIDIDTK